jgi:hypothetical protein
MKQENTFLVLCLSDMRGYGSINAAIIFPGFSKTVSSILLPAVAASTPECLGEISGGGDIYAFYFDSIHSIDKVERFIKGIDLLQPVSPFLRYVGIGLAEGKLLGNDTYEMFYRDARDFLNNTSRQNLIVDGACMAACRLAADPRRADLKKTMKTIQGRRKSDSQSVTQPKAEISPSHEIARTPRGSTTIEILSLLKEPIADTRKQAILDIVSNLLIRP